MGTAHVALGRGLVCIAFAGCMLPSSRQADIDKEMARIREDARQRELAEEEERAKRQSEAMAEMERISQEARAREEAKKRAQACAAQWRPRDIKDAESARLSASEKQSGPGIPDGIPNAPSSRYKLFERYAATLEKQLAMECDVAGREEFEAEWAFLKQEEASRITRLKEHEERLAAARAEREAQRAAFEEEYALAARKRGFARVEFGRSVSEILGTLIEEGTPVSTLRKVAIEYGYADEGFVAQQSLGGGQAIFATSDSDIRLWVVSSSVSMYEGTPLSALISEEQPCFVVTGTKSYRTVAGSTAQAFVVKPAW